ncbi:unnamed protein product [Caenorhabditis brenneri]
MSNKSTPIYKTTPPFPIPPLPEPNKSLNFPTKKYWSIAKDPNYPFDELDPTNDTLKKVVLDEIGKYPSLWRAKSQEAEKNNYSKIAVATFKRTGLLMSLKSITTIYKCAKDNLRNRLRSAIARQNWDLMEIERHMWTWDYYPHIRFYRELTQPWEQSLWIERQRKYFAQAQEMKVVQTPAVENGVGVCVEYPEDDEIIWDPPPPPQPTPQNERPAEPPMQAANPPLAVLQQAAMQQQVAMHRAAMQPQAAMQQTAFPAQAAMQQAVALSQAAMQKELQQNQRLQAPMQTNNETPNSRKRTAKATPEADKQSPLQKKPTPAPIQKKQTPPQQRNNMNQDPVQAAKESPQAPRVPPPQQQQQPPQQYLGADGMMHPVTHLHPQQPRMPPPFNQPHPHPFGNMPHPAFAAQGLPPLNNFVPPAPSGQFDPNMPFPFRGVPNHQFHPNDPRHPMYHSHMAGPQNMGPTRPGGDVQRTPNGAVPNITPGLNQPAQNSQLSSRRSDRGTANQAAKSTNQPVAGNRQEGTSTESKPTVSTAISLATFEQEVSQIAFQAIRIARENPDNIRVLRKVLFDSAFVFDGKTFNSAKEVYKELYDKS